MRGASALGRISLHVGESGRWKGRGDGTEERGRLGRETKRQKEGREEEFSICLFLLYSDSPLPPSEELLSGHILHWCI